MDAELLKKAKSLASRNYQVQLEQEVGRDGAMIWVAFVPEMPACFAQGDTAERAKNALNTVREDYIYFLLKHGLSVPEPTLQGAKRDNVTTFRRSIASRPGTDRRRRITTVSKHKDSQVQVSLANQGWASLGALLRHSGLPRSVAARR